MMEYASSNAGLSIADAYVEASATTALSERDKDIITAYLARRTLIEAFSEPCTKIGACSQRFQGITSRVS